MMLLSGRVFVLRAIFFAAFGCIDLLLNIIMAFKIIRIVIGIDVFAGLKLLDFFVKCFVRCLIVVKLQKFRELVFF